MKNTKYFKCKRDGWVSYAISLAEAEGLIKEFNDWYTAQSEELQSHYSGPATLRDYTCQLCGGSDFRPATHEEVPHGSTVNPVFLNQG